MYELRYFEGGVNRNIRKNTRVDIIKATLNSDSEGKLPLRICRIDIHGNNKGAIWDIDDHENTEAAINTLKEMLEKESVK